MYGRPFKYGAVGSVAGVVLSRMAFVDHGGCQENTESNVQSLTDAIAWTTTRVYWQIAERSMLMCYFSGMREDPPDLRLELA